MWHTICWDSCKGKIWPENGCHSAAIKTWRRPKRRESHIYLWLAISHVCLIPGESPAELWAQQYSLHVFRGFYCGSCRGHQTVKVTLSIPGCLLKIPWECVSRVKGHSDSLPKLNKEKKKPKKLLLPQEMNSLKLIQTWSEDTKLKCWLLDL